MVVAFRHLHHNNSLLDAIDCLATGSKYAHVQIMFSNGQVGGAWNDDKGVSFKTIRSTVIYPYLYDYVPINDDSIDEKKTYDYIASHLGENFSIAGSVASTLLPFGRKYGWHCGDLAFAALRKGGLKTKYRYVPSEMVSPQRIYDILTKELKYKPVKWNEVNFYGSRLQTSAA